MRVRVTGFVKERLDLFQKDLNAIGHGVNASHVVALVMERGDIDFPPKKAPTMSPTLDGQVQREKPLDPDDWTEIDITDATAAKLNEWTERHSKGSEPGAVLHAAVGMLSVPSLLGMTPKP